ncbi:MAG: glycosyltransferase family 39 protein [Anaerolineae bacterium]|nr:glycosyltransferase family 39 protein [Anaerolineae bacterium]
MAWATPIRRGEWLALTLILLLAAALRLGAPGISEFKRDEANMMTRALDLARGRELPLLGLSSSVNVPNPPVSVYLFAVPFLFSDSPLPATLYVGALNVAAVALTWALARRYAGARAALIAALLYAASPWGAIYARKLWAQNLLPPFAVLTVFTALLGYAEGKRWARLAHWPLLALTIQIHYAAVSLAPLSALALALWPRRVRRRELAAGLLLAALTVLPAAIGAHRDGWLSPDAWRERVQPGPDHARILSSRALEQAWLTVAGTDIHALAGPEQFRAYRATVPDADPLFALIPLAAALTAAWWLGRAIWRRRIADCGLRIAENQMRNSQFAFRNLHVPAKVSPSNIPAEEERGGIQIVLAAWLIAPVLLFTWEWTQVVAHYFIPLMPAAYLLAGAGVDAGIGAVRAPRLRRALSAGMAALLALIVALQVHSFATLLDFVDGRATPGGFGPPLHYLLDVRAAILARDPADVIVISDEELAPFDEIPAVWGALLDSLPSVRFVDGTRTAVFPAGDALELIAPVPGLRTCPDAACLDAPETGVFPLRPGEPPYALRPAPSALPLADMTPIAPVRFANGAALTGYALGEGGVALVWELAGPGGADAQAFVHALDASGTRLAQADRPAWPGRYWRAGDQLVLWFDLTLPPETTTLYAGMYTVEGETFRNVAVLDEAGAYLAQGAMIPLGS